MNPDLKPFDAIDNVTLILPDRLLAAGRLLIRDGRLVAVGSAADIQLAGERVLDGRGLLAAPGYLDLQCNGGFGHDFTQHPETIWETAAGLPRFGVTGFLPTIITSPLSRVAAAQDVLTRQPAGFQGARPFGLHIEGPFLNPAKKGAHNPDFLQLPSTAAVQGWSPVSGVRLVTLAPELDPEGEVIGQLVDSGIVVSAGHTLADWDDARTAFDQGVRYATHLFNAMPTLHHREPGLVGAALADERLTIGLISDGIHVHPGLLKTIWRAAHGRINLVTDSMAAMGMPPGRYQLADFEVLVDETRATLADGTLAGSIITMDAAVRYFYQATGCTIPEAVAAVTTVPADLLGLKDQIGRLAAGFPADLVLLTQDLNLAATIIGGRPVYQTEQDVN